jgi:signal transduction histidine kinase
VSWNAELERRVVERTEEVGKYARQLQALTGRLIRAEDDECQRISNVLHEDLQQVLVAARMTLVSVSESVQNVSSKAMIDHVGDMLTQALQLTRSLVQEIAVPAVHEGDLRYVVTCIAQRMREKFGLQVMLTGDEKGVESVGQSVYICLYRVIQELLFNVVKHAGVKQAGIEIRRLGDNSIKIEISDKGCGFSADGLAESIRKGKCFGLLSIRERIEGLGGQLKVVSAVGQGTTVVLTLPTEGV